MDVLPLKKICSWPVSGTPWQNGFCCHQCVPHHHHSHQQHLFGLRGLVLEPQQKTIKTVGTKTWENTHRNNQKNNKTAGTKTSILQPDSGIGICILIEFVTKKLGSCLREARELSYVYMFIYTCMLFDVYKNIHHTMKKPTQYDSVLLCIG